MGSTKNIVCGHEHLNCFSIDYLGITLSYAMKTEYGCYWEDETTEVASLTVDGAGKAKIDLHYIPAKQSELSKVISWYNNHYLPNKEQKYNLFEEY